MKNIKDTSAFIHQVVNFSFLVMLFLTRLFFRLNLLHVLLLPHMSLIYLIPGYLFLTLLKKQMPSNKSLHKRILFLYHLLIVNAGSLHQLHHMTQLQ